jgi:hypothetical protein
MKGGKCISFIPLLVSFEDTKSVLLSGLNSFACFLSFNQERARYLISLSKNLSIMGKKKSSEKFRVLLPAKGDMNFG